MIFNFSLSLVCSEMSVSYLNWNSGYGKTVAVSSAAISALVVAIWTSRKYLQQIQKNKIPTEWRKIGKLSEIFMYPVKSCGVLRLQEVECTEMGPRHGFIKDRMFVVVDLEGTFVSGRTYPLMTQIKPEVRDKTVTLSAPDVEDKLVLDIEKLEKLEGLIPVVLWGNTASGVDCGDEVARWFSKYLLNEEKGLRVLFYPHETSVKPFQDEQNVAGVTTLKDTGTFSDALSFNLMSQSSVNDLNTRLEKPVTPLQFRPTFVIDGFQLLPYEEDKWTWVKIGDTIFQYLSPCGRCVFTTVDPQTGVKHPKFEPLMTLRRYKEIRNKIARKKVNSAPALGIYLGLRTKPETVCVGDDVYIPSE